MKTTVYLILISSILGITACGKTKTKNIEWVFYIDGVEYKSNKATGTFIEHDSRLSITDRINEKNITLTVSINESFFPKMGTFPIGYVQNIPNTSSLSLNINDSNHLKGRAYQANIIAGEQNGKAKYTIEPVWVFTQYESGGVLLESTDSVLLSGTIYEPEEVTLR